MNDQIKSSDIQKIAATFYQPMLKKGFKFHALHEYRDENNNILFWRIRLKHPKTGKKWIRPLYYDETYKKYLLGEPAFMMNKRPLYRLPEILNSKENNKPVWIVEGEQCADVLQKLGLIATTSGSSDSATVTDWSALADRDVILWPDNDDAGIRYARTVTQILEEKNCSISWIDIEELNLSPKEDCVDWLSKHPGATAQKIEDLSLTSPELIPLPQTEHSSQPHFTTNELGVFHHIDENSRWICSPLTIKALIRDKLSENWGRLLEFTDADGLLHRWAMPMELLKGSGEELRGELLQRGVEIAPYQKARGLLVEYILSQKPESRARCVNRIGWYENVFVLPDKTIGKTNEEILYQSEHTACDYKQSGTLEEWQKNISQYCAGNSRLILAVSCAFAAILLKLVDAESGGIHFVGESSTGKTTALRVAASVFGAHDYLSRWRATTNGLEALASIRSDTLLILDELSQVDPREAGEVAYMLANGMGKVRANKYGSAKSRHEWRLLFLSAGEIGLAQHLQEAGKKIKAGQQVRLVDISADAEQNHGIFENLHGFDSGAQLSQVLLGNSQQYYGTPFIHFLEFLTNSNFEEQKETIKKICKLFFSEYFPTLSSGQVTRVCERFALIAAAGEMATRCGITGWSENEAFHATGKCFHSWLEQRGTIGNQEHQAILSQVKGFFELYGDSRFPEKVDTFPIIHHQAHNRAGFKKMINQTYIYYVFPEVFRKEICAGFDYKQVCKTLIEKAWIMPGKNNLAYCREYFPGLGQCQCYVFTSNLWNT